MVALCAFLCSVRAGYLMGQNILVDGGAFPGRSSRATGPAWPGYPPARIDLLTAIDYACGGKDVLVVVDVAIDAGHQFGTSRNLI